MRRGLFRTMAVVNIRKSRRFYLPFLLAAMMSAAMFYGMCSISGNPAFEKSATVKEILKFGVWVLGIFAYIFLFYTNSFLIKRRKRELGLYHILGLEKRHITRILAWEVFWIGLAALTGGLVTGILLDRLLFLIILYIFRYPVSTVYQLSVGAAVKTALVFAVLFVLIFFFDARSIRRASAAELLDSQSAGEREPKVRWAVAALGVICLAGGYYIALTVRNLLTALTMLLAAVLLVMCGTYCLFLAGSIAVLKMLRRRKSYYYRTSHFVAVSGLLYRMKQNAVGLANICILSTGVLLVLSTTLCLYAGMRDILLSRFPAEFSVEYDDSTKKENEALDKLVKSAAGEAGTKLINYHSFRHISVTVEQKDNAFVALDEQNTSWQNLASVSFVTAADYEGLSGQRILLSKNEAAVYTAKGQSLDSFVFLGQAFDVTQQLSKFPLGNQFSQMTTGCYNVVVADDEVLEQLDGLQKAVYAGTAASALQYRVTFDVEGGESAAVPFDRRLRDTLNAHADAVKLPSVDCRYLMRDELHALYGSMLFLGVYLGVLFLAATVLIIYYKQISEGYEDRERFVIMQKVGMDRREVKKAVRSQIRLLFFLPLATALIHCLVAFNLMTMVMRGFYMNNVRLFAGVTAAVAGVFTVGYLLVFAATSRTYYQIVS